jgi:hypothetical protein
LTGQRCKRVEGAVLPDPVRDRRGGFTRNGAVAEPLGQAIPRDRKQLYADQGRAHDGDRGNTKLVRERQRLIDLAQRTPVPDGDPRATARLRPGRRRPRCAFRGCGIN